MAPDSNYMSRPDLHLPSDDKIVALCDERGLECTGFVYPCHRFPIAYIKYGYTVTMGEMWTQRFVHNALQQRRGPSSGFTIQTPEIYRAFRRGERAYIVMEYVDGETVEACLNRSSPDLQGSILAKVAEAISQLARLRVPMSSTPGPAGGGLIRNEFFKDGEARRTYSTIGGLESHINEMLQKGRSPKRVDFSNDHLVLCYSDITPGNFLITNDGRVCVIDFGHAAFLPTSFIGFLFSSSVKPFARLIRHRVCLPPSANNDAMRMASYFFHIS